MKTEMAGPYAEMTINEDGTAVATKIVGIKGKACEKAQSHFNGLGERTSDMATAEYYQEPQVAAVNKVPARG